MKEDEMWKPVVGAEGWYEVSSLGRLRRARPGKATSVGKILRPATRKKDGRVAVSYRVDGRDVTNSVHRLVALAFLGECPAGKEVNHIDGDPSNNRSDNLEYVTRRENMQHAFKLGLAKLPFGEDQHLAKLSTEQAIVIRHCSAPNRLLARVFGVKHSTIALIKKGKTWKHAIASHG